MMQKTEHPNKKNFNVHPCPVTEFLVIDARHSFDICVNFISCQVRLKAERAWSALQEIPKIGKLVQDEVKSVSERAVELSGGQSLPYDYLILATGSIYKGKEWEAPELAVASRKAKHQVISSLFK